MVFIAYLPRIVLPWIVRRANKRMNNFTTPHNNTNTKNTARHAPRKKKKIADNVGHYVDFEEIKEA
jgi:hypothetical protein